MKECEMFSSLKVPCGSKILLRLDGRGFYNLSKQIGLKKPYDPFFLDAMVNTATEIFKEFSPSFIYTFSDEFNILLADIPFSGRIEKLNSVFASFTANSFYSNIIKNKISQRIYQNSENNNNNNNNNNNATIIGNLEIEEIFKTLKTISFDCRVIPLSSEMVSEYFKGRQNEAWRNCINGYIYWTLRDEMNKEKAMKILNGLKADKIHDILFERGINIAEVPVWQRRGVGIYKVDKIVNGYNPLSKESTTSSRRVIKVDFDLPRFDNEFFHNFIE
ncbi:MAG: tRNA(His) guanylyltransferase Thg1 family protein [Methanobacteriaceae archaeon]|nr:tRNA(His) guanylyltransferase Thg1 family protein [Methanobacteriaceae archaeon]MDO9626989.1 tRNA(His) guanylyltransferase Thg1 family protein [Methanobacteriaceae archaeon]